MKKAFLISVTIFIFSFVTIQCSDDSQFIIVSAAALNNHNLFPSLTSAKQNPMGPRTLDETIAKHEHESTVRAAQLKKLSEILARASRRQAELQLSEQDSLAALQQLKLMKQEHDAKRLARLQNTLQSMKTKEEAVTAEIAKLAPNSSPSESTAGNVEPAEKSTQSAPASSQPSTSSWSLWKLIPFTS